jgi:uracil-DNA glycosylase
MPKPSAAWSRHLDALAACRTCPGVQPPSVIGAVPGSRIYLMGQAPGPREAAAGRPFAWTAGQTLFKWFATLGVDEATFRERVTMAAVISCFPGKLPGKQGDRKPSRQEIETCGVHRRTELRLLQPDLAIPVGRMAIEWFIPCPSLDAVVGRQFRVDFAALEGLGGSEIVRASADLIPLPHPSGLSRWIQQPAGKRRIAQALERIAAHPAWRATFPEGGRP